MRVSATSPRLAYIMLLALALLNPPVVRAQLDSFNMELIGRWSMSGLGYNDVWGYTDSTGREYAIIGTTEGTAIVEITDSTNVHLVSFIGGPQSVWRDIDSWDRYAYVTTEAPGVGMQIIDLSGLPDSVKLVGTYNTTISNAHTLFIGTDGFAYICGAWRFPSTSGGGLNILNLSNPVSPVEVGTYSVAYIHDVYVRNDTAFGAGLDTGVHIIDVSSRSTPTLINRFEHGEPFTHNTWTTENGSYLCTTDEYPGGHLKIFDVRDPFNVNLVGEFTANPDAIIHNVYVRGDLAVMAYYTEGVRIANISDPIFPIEVGSYDTSPVTPPQFAGVWGAYPYFPSGKIAASDMQNGLYVFRFTAAGVQPGRVEGIVTDSQTGNPVSDVLVQTLESGKSVSTDVNGWYRVGGLPGPITLVFSKRTNYSGFYPDTLQLTLESGAAIDGSIALTPLPSGTVRGRITRAETEAPLRDIPVKVEGIPLMVLTDANGEYSLPLLLADTTYTLLAVKLGYRPEARPVNVLPGQVHVENFNLIGELADEFEFDLGWALESTSVSGAGVWQRIDPEPVYFPSTGATVQPDTDHTAIGTAAYFTGGTGIIPDNVEGITILTSPAFDVMDFADPAITYYRWFFSNPVTEFDYLQAEISNDGGFTWAALENVKEKENEWKFMHFRVGDYLTPTGTMKVRFVAADGDRATLVEAGVDDFAVIEALTTTENDVQWVPGVYQVDHNFPNPFNPSTVIRYQLPRSSRVSLIVYDLLGQQIATLVNGEQSPGSYSVEFSGEKLPSGIYFYRFQAEPERMREKRGLAIDFNGTFTVMKKMLLMK